MCWHCCSNWCLNHGCKQSIKDSLVLLQSHNVPLYTPTSVDGGTYIRCMTNMVKVDEKLIQKMDGKLVIALVAVVQSMTTLPGFVEVSMSICMNIWYFSHAPRQGLLPFNAWSALPANFYKIPSWATSWVRASRARIAWKVNFEDLQASRSLTNKEITNIRRKDYLKRLCRND